MSIKLRVWGGGFLGGGGGSADFIFMGARIFLNEIRKRAEYCFERELTEFCGKLAEFYKKNSVSSL